MLGCKVGKESKSSVARKESRQWAEKRYLRKEWVRMQESEGMRRCSKKGPRKKKKRVLCVFFKQNHMDPDSFTAQSLEKILFYILILDLEVLNKV